MAFSNCGSLIIHIPKNFKSRYLQMEGIRGFENQLVEYEATEGNGNNKSHKQIYSNNINNKTDIKNNYKIAIIIIIIAIIGFVMLFNAKCAKTKSNHHYDHFDPSMEYRHSD
jgi:hypothetical protein